MCKKKFQPFLNWLNSRLFTNLKQSQILNLQDRHLSDITL